MSVTGVEEREQSRLVQQETDEYNMHLCVVNVIYKKQELKTVTFTSKLGKSSMNGKYRMVKTGLQ
jgi:hypothetical protein